MNKKLFLLLAFGAPLFSCAQKTDISAAEATRIETYLASDELGGRRPGTPGIEKAAAFIADEFRKAGLQPLPGATGFLQEFPVLRPKQTLLKAEVNEQDFDVKNVLVVTTKKEFKVNEKSGFRVMRLAPQGKVDTRQVFSEVRGLASGKENLVVLVDTAYSRLFPRFSGLKRAMLPSEYDVVFLLTQETPRSFTVKAEHSFAEERMANVVGVLPGTTRASEQVIFSGHYDHLGIGKPVNGDSIYNGANDDASGITSVILLAQHFAKLKNNARGLMFVAFTAEESGGWGAQYFSRQLDPARVMAMFNIEMIGTESKWGRNSAFITGFDKTDMGVLLQKSLKGSGFDFHPDPYPEQDLFYRSDNATLAYLGVPAHTISTSKMDVEPHYHKPSDEVGTLDMANLAKITEAIARSAAGIISGTDTPTRVKQEKSF
ncbi:M28 family peptidase [Flaviaesturariibacter amylovorans]|uniref:Peptidase M28 domain-containing protein n=1 Tax=Flaviaesturariibacter amylovorans TaxID=1084520 RepID=A0ABP8H8T1_9BACT